MIKKFKTPFILFVVILFAFGLCASSLASPKVDWDRTGSISVTLYDRTDGLETAVVGASFKLYHVANFLEDAENDYRIEYTEAFAACPVSLEDISAAGLAGDILAFAEEHSISYELKTAGEDGTVVFENLPLGIYLIAQGDKTPGYYPITPFLVTVPMGGEDGYIYDVDASPKVEAEPETPIQPEYRSVTVRKVWEDDNDKEGKRPPRIMVDLLMDGEVVDTVELNASNNWSYTWSHLAANHSYTVRESEVPSGYISTGAQIVNNEFIITNRLKLPQTGQLNWPIPVLAGAGLLLIAVGLIIIIGKKKNKKDA